MFAPTATRPYEKPTWVPRRLKAAEAAKGATFFNRPPEPPERYVFQTPFILGAELLFDVISSAYERSSLIVTTNLPFENWTEVLGSERLTGATLDRLTHRCHIIECNGESYRLQDANRLRLKPPKRPAV